MDTRIQKKELIMLFDNKEILKHITDGVIGIDSGKIIKMFSPGAEKIFNYSSTEIIDKPFSSLIETTESLEEKLKKKIYPIRNISGTGKSDI
ncbi:MAG: PAS domain S-box protein, partial [bacterium]|nr:PAS domain S-box protein [bacterium]